jgi:hypothetical protein
MSLAKPDVITLSKGSVWSREYRALEYHQNAWPDFATAYVEFRNTRGALLVSIQATEVTDQAIRFLAQPEEHADIPAGAKFEVFVNTDDGPMQIRYGTVIRRESTFYDAPAAERRDEARVFTDTFQRTRLGDRWEPVRGATRIYDNSASSLANGVGANVGLFANQPSAIKYYKQLATNSVEIGVTFVNPGNSDGKAAVALCADIMFTSGLAVQWDSVGDVIRFGRITSPTSIVQLGAPIPNVVANNDYHRIVYNDLTDTLYVFDGPATTPMGSWFDQNGEIPHGNGYCHTGFIFNPGNTLIFGSTGPQPSGWTAKDTV